MLSLLLTTAHTLAQNINGRLVDNDRQPVEFANVVLFALPDSAFVQGTISAADGTFQLPSDGKSERLLRISSIGYTTIYKKFTAGNVGDISLSFDTQVLSEVVVKASLPATRLRGDALVTNVQAGVLAKAGSATDVLGKIPGIMQTEKNAFEVFGKGAPLIYINGRQVRDASELESLRSEDIKEVELITNPGAKYDSTVKAVIRIKTLQRRGDGFGFNLRSTWYQWDQTDLIEEVRMNYRHNGLDVFGAFRYDYNESYRDGQLVQTIYADETWMQKNHIVEYKRRFGNYRGEVGLNYQINDDHSVGARYTCDASPSSHSQMGIVSDIMRSGQLYDQMDNNVYNHREPETSHRLNAYYNGKVGELEIDFNADYFSNGQEVTGLTVEESKNYEDREVNSMGTVKNSLAAAKLVLSYPVLGGNVSWGGEYTYTRRNDDYVNPENYVPTTYSLIKEDNISAFAEFNRKFSFGQLSAGVRYEHVQFDYFEEGNRMDDQSREFDNWFPNVSFGTDLGKVHTLLSYTAKTIRPSYRQLGNTVTYANRFTAETGNPTLKPSILHDITLSGSWKFLQASVSYQMKNDPILYWSRPVENNPGAAMLYQENYDKIPSLRAFVAVSPTIGWWLPRVSLGVVKQWLDMECGDETLHLDTPVWTLGLSNSFKLPTGLLLNVDYRLRSKGHNENYYLSRTGHLLGASLRKSFLKEALDVTLGMSDILYKNNPYNSAYSPYMQMSMDNKFDTREVYMTVRYNFNTSKNKYKGTGAGEETLRRL